MKWVKTGRTVSPKGTTITYTGDNGLMIESRKRHIPHANRSGTWDHTSYWLLSNGKEVKEFYSLKAAKDAAERFEGKHGKDICMDQEAE